MEDKTVISCLRWYTSDWYGLLITVSGVGCVVDVGDDFSHTAQDWIRQLNSHFVQVLCASTSGVLYTSLVSIPPERYCVHGASTEANY